MAYVRFAKGQSGNPGGRRRGSRNKATLLRDQLALDAESILDGLIQQAKNGDIGAAKFLLALVIPKAAETPVRVQATGSLVQKGEAVLDAALRGRITPGDASALLGAVAGLARTEEIASLRGRLEKLEEIYEANNQTT